jgi:hypothetical protein
MDWGELRWLPEQSLGYLAGAPSMGITPATWYTLYIQASRLKHYAVSGFGLVKMRGAQLNGFIIGMTECRRVPSVERALDCQPGIAFKERVADFMSTPKNYILRDIPADLWRQVKVEAATEGVSVREVILRGLKGYTYTQQHQRERTEAVRARLGGTKERTR